MIYILIHKTKEREISRHFTVMKEAQNFMWNEYDEVIKEAIDRKSGCRGGDWCEIVHFDKSKESWNIYPVNIPKTESICVTYKTGMEVVYFITKKELTNDNFFIYQYNTETNETVKLGKGNNPILLEQKYIEKSSQH